jgi:hypothetical protein
MILTTQRNDTTQQGLRNLSNPDTGKNLFASANSALIQQEHARKIESKQDQ